MAYKYKVDACLTVYGKPWQTATSLFSLLEHNSGFISKIWVHEEPRHIYNDEVTFIFPWFNDKLVHYKPPLFLGSTGEIHRVSDPQYRLSVRYQKPFEESDADYLFICHNDTFFVDDIVKQMLDRLRGSSYTAIGQIGQEWNCPAFKAGLCNGDIHESYRPTYQEAIDLIKRVPSPRTRVSDISPNDDPIILPECRLNEFACLIDLNKARPFVVPNGNVMPIGLMIHDTGTEFFKGMRRVGQRFLNYPGNFHHAKFTKYGNGHSLEDASQCDNYWDAEQKAKQYCEEHYKEKMI